MKRHPIFLAALVSAGLIALLTACGGGGGGGGGGEPTGPTVCADLSATASPQIQSVRDAALGNSLALSVSGAFVTYVRDTSIGSDPAGFFVQAEQEGPAVFVAVDPVTLDPVPAVGDQVLFEVTTVADLNSLVQVTGLTGWSRTCQEPSVSWMAQDVSSATDLVSAVDSYESELIDLDGEVVGDFSSAGSGFVSAEIETAGVSGEANLVLRIPGTLKGDIEIENGCQFTLDDTPLWRFYAVSQPSAWTTGDIMVTSCPAPQVMSAVATSSALVRVTFSRDVAPSSVLANGSQFTFTGGLTAYGASVSGDYVTVATSAQTAATAYTVTVAGTVTDTLGTGVDPAADSAPFTGYDPAEIVINEVYYDSPGTDQQVFIELKGPSGASLANLTLVGVNGAGGADYVDIALSGTIPGDGYFVVADTTTVVNYDTIDAGANLQNGPDSVQLVFDYGGASEQVIDAVGYGTFTVDVFAGEGTPAPSTGQGESLSRCPDGNDSNDNDTDFVITATVTPGAANSCP